MFGCVLLQPARSVCVSLSAFFIHVSDSWTVFDPTFISFKFNMSKTLLVRPPFLITKLIGSSLSNSPISTFFSFYLPMQNHSSVSGQSLQHLVQHIHQLYLSRSSSTSSSSSHKFCISNCYTTFYKPSVTTRPTQKHQTAHVYCNVLTIYILRSERIATE